MKTDKQLIDWLSRRKYVEATSAGYEDKKRFEWHATKDFRQALSDHIDRHSRRTLVKREAPE